jgi:hypothetical protein
VCVCSAHYLCEKHNLWLYAVLRLPCDKICYNRFVSAINEHQSQWDVQNDKREVAENVSAVVGVRTCTTVDLLTCFGE